MEAPRKLGSEVEQVVDAVETWPTSGDSEAGLPKFPGNAKQVWLHLFRLAGQRTNVSVRFSVGWIMHATGHGERLVRKLLERLADYPQCPGQALHLISKPSGFKGQLTATLNDPRTVKRARLVTSPIEDQAELPFETPAAPAEETDNPILPMASQPTTAFFAHKGPALFAPAACSAESHPSGTPVNADQSEVALTALCAHEGPGDSSLKSLGQEKNKEPISARAQKQDLRETALHEQEGPNHEAKDPLTAGLEPSPEARKELERCRRNSAKDDVPETLGGAVQQVIRKQPTEAEKHVKVEEVTDYILKRVNDPKLYRTCAKKVAWQVVHASFDQEKLEEVLDYIDKNRAAGLLKCAYGYFNKTMETIFTREYRPWKSNKDAPLPRQQSEGLP